MIDEGSRYALGAHLEEVSAADNLGNTTAPELQRVLEEDWVRHFGKPKVIRSDPEGCINSHLMYDWAQGLGMKWSMSAGQAHWQMGIVERHVAVIK